MASLADERLWSLHREFIDGGKRFSNLRFVAVTAADESESRPEEDRWPCVVHGDHRCYGLHPRDWRRILTTDSPLGPIAVWLRIDGRLWQGGLFNRKRLDDLNAEHSSLMEAVTVLEELAEKAANHFGMSPSPAPPNDLLSQSKAQRWMEAVAAMDFVSVENRCGYLVRELPNDVFWDSARVIEILASKQSTALPEHSEENGEAFVTPKRPDLTTRGDKSNVTWQFAAAYLENLRVKGEAFQSQERYAETLHCSSATVNKAIQRTETLKDWAKRPISSTSSAVNIEGVVLDSVAQWREADPADVTEPADVDLAMAYLIESAGPEERARIHAMSPAEKRTLAETAYRDPDRERQILEADDTPHSR